MAITEVVHGQAVQPVGGFGPGLPLPAGPLSVDGAVAKLDNGGSLPGAKQEPVTSPLPVEVGPFTDGVPSTPLVRTVVVMVFFVM